MMRRGLVGQGLQMAEASKNIPTQRGMADDQLVERLRLALDFSDVGEWSWDAATDAVDLSPLACRIFGIAPGTAVTWTQMQDDLLHREDAPIAARAVLESIESRTAYRVEYRIRRAIDGEQAWILARGKARYDDEGRVFGMIGLVQDVTERKLEQLALKDEATSLDILNRTGALVASELDQQKMVQAVTDAGVQLTGAQFGAFFYNVIGERGEQYMLYTISGVQRSDFDKFPMPRNTPVFAPTFNGAGVIRSGDITKDPRYGTMEPHRGMPRGHLPVRSYLAVPVIARTGEVLGGLFFGHAQPDVFSERDERLLVGVAAHAAIAVDNARMVERLKRELDERQKAETALRLLADLLEARVQERTSQLEAANEQLRQQIAERERVEETLRHAQKLESIGQLTGGIAHDFNNLLTVVIGNLDTLTRRPVIAADARVRRYVDLALEGAQKAAVLTQRLLAFARRQPLRPEPADVNRLVKRTSEMLSRTLGEQIETQTVLGVGTWTIEVDIAQLENALLNLAINSRDAMPEGGKLTIETTNVHIDEAYSRANAMDVGQYVLVCVSDTGIGIPADVLDKVFDPFFTTKTTGQGTGLGLSQVYGFVKQSGGHVRIYSEVGEGTTVKLYLPRYTGPVEQLHAVPETLVGGDSDETVLVVEDEPSVRQLSVSLFQELGYAVLEAPDGPTALDILARTARVDLLFTDVGLPKMNGRELAEAARVQRPDLKVLFTTGYARNAIVHHGRLDRGVDLLGKPFTFAQLAEKVRLILDRQ
jgi:PAS domain S-box-containing protein